MPRALLLLLLVTVATWSSLAGTGDLWSAPHVLRECWPMLLPVTAASAALVWALTEPPPRRRTFGTPAGPRRAELEPRENAVGV